MKQTKLWTSIIASSILIPSGIYISKAATAPVNQADVSPRDNWGLKPLGPDVPKPQWKPAPIKKPLKTHFKSLPARGEPLVFVQDQTACAVLTLPANANSSAKEAAQVLQHAFEEMSGVTLPIASENEIVASKSTFTVDGQSYGYLISIGDTQLAKAADINADDLVLDGYRLKTKGKVLFLVGRDKAPFADAAGRPLPEGATMTRYLQANGTRNGAYALLERHFGCRWLWPEEGGGVVYPSQKVLLLKPINESDQPAMAARGIRNYYPEHGKNAYGRRQQQTVLPMMGRSYSGLLKKAANSGAWFEAMKLGTSMEYNVGHAYSGYWKKYGETHPEWFALQADGTRDMTRWYEKVGSRAHLDVTNQELIEHIANEVIAKFDADPSLTSVSIAPNDGSYPSFCLCEVCRRLDPPNGDPIRFSIVDETGKASRITYPSLTDRYLIFYNKIAEIVAKKYPDKLLGAYAYSVYSSPPLYAKVSPNVFLSYVGLSYFNDEERQHDLQSWDIWSQSVDKLLLRPNALLGAYGFPAVFAHKLGNDIKHTYQTGMIGTDFDSLTHNWSTRGINYYVLAKLLWDPSLDIDALIKDYCDKGFGPASADIQQYFSLLEKLTNEVAENGGDIASGAEDGLNPNSVRGVLSLINETYTPERLAQLQQIIDSAKKNAAGHSTVLERIVFLEQGLRYANAEKNWLRAYFSPSSPDKKQRVQDALDARLKVFQDIYDNHFYSVSVFMPLYREGSMFKEYDWPVKEDGK